MEKANKQSAVVLFRGAEPPSKETVENALSDLGAKLAWQGEADDGSSALLLELGDHQIAVSLLATPLANANFADALASSGLDGSDEQGIQGHESHGRIISLETAEPTEPADRMWLVYRIAARLINLGGAAILAPSSGVFVLEVDTGYVDSRREENVPPMDLWTQVEMGQDKIARSVGAAIAGVPEVELKGLDGLEPDVIYSTVLGALVYLRQIRREMTPGESFHIGDQKWFWAVTSGSPELVQLERVNPV